MSFVEVGVDQGVATVRLARGKVNALNPELLRELGEGLRELESDDTIRSVILTGRGSFFSFGFDVPELLPYGKREFTRFLEQFTGVYAYLFRYPKPLIAALNGHAIAGGCMLALACDVRLMTADRGKISLNEISFGSSVFSGSIEMLRFCVGDANATEILYSGDLYSAGQALFLRLVQEVCSEDDLEERARIVALELGRKSQPAFGSIKSLLRKPALDEMRRREADSIHEFVEIWYSEATQEGLRKIRIR